ncbi:MAG: hypothetical protein QS748_06410 [Candidatus Endonucleobacter bathymodioli]|uniref:RAP domain-containing protein n=1 Tax=Candidatus Endonucleibacter bathymodioli TaxID=539814 RepID=A0AA90NT97_9GAMM|nr:hypothetical protein [Candidatus Endonucleobacter bathymodioli]
MIQLHRILLLFIFITSTVLLFSYNAYGVYNKNIEPTLNSSKTYCNIPKNVSASVKYLLKPETCVYNTDNRIAINNIIRKSLNGQQLGALQYFLMKAMEHPTKCLRTHNVDNVIIFFTAANKCKDASSISKLADQLATGKTGIANHLWSCHDIWRMSTAISMHSSYNISYIRKIIAKKIVHPNNDMSQWQPYHITNALKSLIEGNSHREEKAFEYIVDYIGTKNCNIDHWGCHKLSLLFECLSKSKTKRSDIAMLKVLDIIIESEILYCNANISATMFRALVRLQKTHFSDIKNEASYGIVMQLIINNLSLPEINFIDCDGHTIADTMDGLRHMSKLGWQKNTDKARQRWAKFIVEEDINTLPMSNNDWIMIIRGLTNNSIVEQEAMQTMAAHFNDSIIIPSLWSSSQLLHIATAFSYNHGRRIEKAIQKIANFAASANLESWNTLDLARLAKALSTKTRDIHHKAIDNIAGHILKKSIQFPIIDYIDLAFTVSLGKGDHCLEFIRYISNEVGDDSFYLLHLSPIFLAKLISIVSKDDEKYAEKALNKITNCLIGQNTEQWLNLSSEYLKLIANACSKHYQLTTAISLLRHISFILINDRIDLSDWPIDTLEVLLRTLNSPDNDNLTQQSFKKIVAQLNLSDTKLRKWSINTLACVAKGVSRWRDYSSEEFIERLAHTYMKKRDYDESKHGITILLAICHLPIDSEKIIETATELALVLYNTADSNMDTEDKLSLFWAITLLDFVAHEEGRVNVSSITKDIIVELTKTIPEIDQDTINKHTIFLDEWQIEFINIMHSYRADKSSDISLSTYDHEPTSILEGDIHSLIKTTIPDLSVDINCRVNKFPIDILLSSRSKSDNVVVEVDGPQHVFKDSCNRQYRVAKDRFVDFVLDELLGYKVIRINHHEAHDHEYRKLFIQTILAIFPDYVNYYWKYW